MLLSQLVDLQIFATPRVALKPLVPTFPCFANIVASLMEKVSANATELTSTVFLTILSMILSKVPLLGE